MQYLRTPEERFENLDGFDFTPHYLAPLASRIPRLPTAAIFCRKTRVNSWLALLSILSLPTRMPE